MGALSWLMNLDFAATGIPATELMAALSISPVLGASANSLAFFNASAAAIGVVRATPDSASKIYGQPDSTPRIRGTPDSPGE